VQLIDCYKVNRFTNIVALRLAHSDSARKLGDAQNI